MAIIGVRERPLEISCAFKAFVPSTPSIFTIPLEDINDVFDLIHKSESIRSVVIY